MLNFSPIFEQEEIMTFKKITDLDLSNKRVLIREDFNVPMDEEGNITSDARIRAALETLQWALKQKARVIVISHLGRPKEGVFDPKLSLLPVAKRLSTVLGVEVPLAKDWLDGINVAAGKIVLCENVRFNVGEMDNDEELSKKMAKLCDIYVNDAFATAHRKEASTYGVALAAPVACAGLLLSAELEALGKIMQKPRRPLAAIVGGAKVSSKLKVLKSIAKIADYLIIGGGIANTFIAAMGYKVGTSLYEPELVNEAKALLELAKNSNVKIPLPIDVIVANEFSATAKTREVKISEVKDDDKILDIGTETRKLFAQILADAKTILWNGPVGAFELEPFSHGTEAIARAVADSDAYSVAGGGDTIAAIEKYGIEDQVSYISTGGGAFLEYLEKAGRLPAVEALEK